MNNAGGGPEVAINVGELGGMIVVLPGVLISETVSSKVVEVAVLARVLIGESVSHEVVEVAVLSGVLIAESVS